MRSFRRAVTLLLGVPALAGCLSSSYQLSSAELRRLAELPPEQRAGRVRVVQQLGLESDPPAAEAATVIEVEPPVVVAIGVGAPMGPPPPRWRRGPRPVGGSAGPNGQGGGDGRGGDTNADGDAVVAFAIVSAVLGVGLAVTEGSRFDGWATLDANQPVHLFGPNGEYGWVPLSKLDPSIAAWAAEAVVSGDEGRLLTLERAPLHRAGFAFGIELGTGSANGGDAAGPLGFTGRTSFGYFPASEAGLLLSLGFRAGAGEHGGRATEWRPALELQLYPFALGALHLGLYGEVGYGAGIEVISRAPDQRLESNFYGGGALLQLEVTTRLALTLRAGVSAFSAPGPSNLLPQVTAGIAVY